MLSIDQFNRNKELIAKIDYFLSQFNRAEELQVEIREIERSFNASLGILKHHDSSAGNLVCVINNVLSKPEHLKHECLASVTEILMSSLGKVLDEKKAELASLVSCEQQPAITDAAIRDLAEDDERSLEGVTS